MIRRTLILAALLLSASCAGATTDGATSAPDATASAALEAELIKVGASSYGSLSLVTAPGARCTVQVTAPLGKLADGPPGSVTAQADAAGQLLLTYVAPRVPAGTGTHTVTCSGERGTSSVNASFTVPSGMLSATRFTARITASPVPTDEKSVREDPTLVPLRDAAVTKLNSSLRAAWKDATRGLSQLDLAPGSADIVVKVVAAKAQSVHRTAPDSSEDVLIYVADQSGRPYALENVVAVTLHELGHIWCCRGAGTVDGHWTTQEESPGLLGVDRFGLMNHPVNCLVVPSGFLSCPNHFSDRELRTMGYEQPPPPVADPCVSQRDALLAQIATLKSQLDGLKATIDSTNATLTQLAAQIKAIEDQYPSKVLPPDVYGRYQSLVTSYNARLHDTQPTVDQYNATRDAHNAIVAQRNALAC